MNIQSVDLNLLAVLDALLEERNVTRAAVRVHLSQPATSNALARLRHLFGDPLLVRGNGGMVLTPYAQALLGPLRSAMNQVDAVLAVGTSFDAATSTDTFTIASSDALQIGFVPPLLTRLTVEAPGAKVICVPLGGTAQPTGDPVPERELAAGGVDLALGFFAAPPPQLHGKALFDGDFVCVLRDGHPFADSGMTPEAFAQCGHVVIAPAHHDHSTVDVALAKHRLVRRIAVVVPQYNVVPYIVARSDLVAVLPRRLAEGFVPIFGLKLLPAPIALPRFTIWQLWHERTHRSPAHRWLRSRVGELVASLAEPRAPVADRPRGRTRPSTSSSSGASSPL